VSRQRAAIAAALCALVALGYSGVGQLEFLSYDDDMYVTQNPLVNGGLGPHALLRAFTVFHAGNWHPLTWLSHMLDVSLFGLTPAGPHLENAVLHAANAVLAFLALARLTGTTWRAAFAAALFAIHPLRVESVAWIAERKDVLSAGFGLAALWSYACWARRESPAAYRGAVGLHLAALLAKPMLVTLPFLFLLLDAWPLRRLTTRGDLGPRLAEKAPFWLLCAGSCVVTLFAQAPNMSPLSLRMRLDNSVVAYVEYLRRALVPIDLAAMYPYRLLETRLVVASALLLVAITGLALWQARRRPWLLVGWLWFAGMLVPTLGLVQVGVQPFADRYSYLPFLGLSLAVAWQGAELAQRLPRGREAMAVAAALVLAGCAWQTRRQVATWHDTLTLFSHAVEVTRSNWFAHTEVGVALAERGDFEGARESFEAALRIRPDYARALANLGKAQAALGDFDAGIQSLERALFLEPDIAGGRLAYASALEHAQRFAEAERAYAAAAGDPRGSRDARLRLARLLSVAPDGLRDGARALALCQQVCGEAPCDSPEELDVWGMAAMEAGRPEEAVAHANQAIALAQARGDGTLAAKIEARRAGYARGQPVRLLVR
jgi:protein O-mannosyl-transferase